MLRPRTADAAGSGSSVTSVTQTAARLHPSIFGFVDFLLREIARGALITALTKLTKRQPPPEGERHLPPYLPLVPSPFLPSLGGHTLPPFLPSLGGYTFSSLPSPFLTFPYARAPAKQGNVDMADLKAKAEKHKEKLSALMVIRRN